MVSNDSVEADEFDPTELLFVGPVTAAVLADAPFDARGIADRTVSYRMLLDVGVNPGVAAKIRREHSLHWSFGDTGDADLARRSKSVRGLREEERAWIEASQDGWEHADRDAQSTPDVHAETDGSGAADEAEAAWRERSRPIPVADVPGIDARTVETLAAAGITSARSLSTVDPDHVGDALDLDPDLVASWCEAARDHVE